MNRRNENVGLFAKRRIKKQNELLEHIQKVIALAQAELVNPNSVWRKELVEDVVLPEMQELYEHFSNGERYFKYINKRGILRIKQRLLQSTYHILDTLLMEKLNLTELGKAIREVQDLYYKI